MKKRYVIIPAILIFLPLFQISAQVYEWTEPAPFVNSQHDKSNAWLCVAQGLGSLLLWEEKTDENSTAIFYQRYLSNDPPVMVLSEPSVHFRNPKIQNAPFGSGEIVFLLFFEKEENATTGIYYLEFFADGSYSDPMPLSTGGTQNIELTTNTENYNGHVAWNSDGNILVSKRSVQSGNIGFEEPDTLGFGNCSEPQINSESRICWKQSTEGSDYIFTSYYSYLNSWTTPEEVVQAEEIKNLAVVEVSFFSYLFSWTYKENGSWFVSNWDGDQSETLAFIADEPFDFGVYSMDVIFDKTLDWWGEYYFACVQPIGNHNEIFIFQEYYWEELEQLSYLETECRNPKFFTGEWGSSGIWIYLIWESLVDGNWQLYYSKYYMVIGGIDDVSLSQDVQISPNPATDFIRIQNSKELEISIRIFDATGKLVFQSQDKDLEISITTQNWPRGIYLLNVLNGEKKLTRKIILE